MPNPATSYLIGFFIGAFVVVILMLILSRGERDEK